MENQHVLIQKLLNPNSISWSLFDDSDNEDKLSENDEESSENEDSVYSSEIENEEDVDENEINKIEDQKISKFNNKDAYLKYLSSINSQTFELHQIYKENDVKLNNEKQLTTEGMDYTIFHLNFWMNLVMIYLDWKKQGKKKHHRIPKTKKEIYKISKMNKLMYKQKRKAITNKENRDEENKMDKNNIIELLHEWSLEESSNIDDKNKCGIKSKGSFKNYSKKEHLNNNSYDFIKSLGWVSDKKLFGHSKHFSREYDSYQYDNYQFEQSGKQNWNKPRNRWDNQTKGYYQKQSYFSQYE